MVQVCVPLAGAPGGTALPSPATADSLLQAGWRPDLVLQMPRELYQPALWEHQVLQRTLNAASSPGTAAAAAPAS